LFERKRALSEETKKGAVRRALVSLSLAFSCAAIPAFAGENPEKPPAPGIEKAEGLWKVEYVNAVIRIEKCPGKTACASLYWLDPDDARIYDNLANPKEKQKKMWDDPVTREDVLSLCGFSPNMDIRPAPGGGWEGTLETRGTGVTANIAISMVNDDEMRVVGSKFLLTREEKWRRVSPDDKKYPACKKPSL
jgi:hypothetical protein